MSTARKTRPPTSGSRGSSRGQRIPFIITPSDPPAPVETGLDGGIRQATPLVLASGTYEGSLCRNNLRDWHLIDKIRAASVDARVAAVCFSDLNKLKSHVGAHKI